MVISTYITTELARATKSLAALDQYLQLIDTVFQTDRYRYLKKDPQYVYYEQHHILPKSLYPQYSKEKTNLVLLTAKEHFIAHQLLVKIFPGPEMTCAYFFMTKHGDLAAEELQKLKQDFATAISNKLAGVAKTEDHRKHISEGRLGLSYGPLSDEHKQKISNSLKGRAPSALNRKINSERCKKRTGSKNAQSRKIRCIEDNIVFNTIHECEQYYGILHLYRYCSTGKVHSKLNKHFEYIEREITF